MPEIVACLRNEKKATNKRVILSRISVFKKIAQNSYTGGFRGEKSRGTKIFEK